MSRLRLLEKDELDEELKAICAESRMLGMQDVPLTRIVGRFIHAFHAALYREYLPFETNSAIQLPFPSARQTEKGVEFEGILRQYPIMIEVLKKNRIAGNIDEITSWSGKCRYFCVWSRFDNGVPFCLFALRIYEWEKLADTTHFPKRACVGGYWNGVPPGNATRATTIEIPCRNLHPLDPFSD